MPVEARASPNDEWPTMAGDSMAHHRVLIGLMERGDLDWKANDAWLRENVDES